MDTKSTRGRRLFYHFMTEYHSTQKNSWQNIKNCFSPGGRAAQFGDAPMQYQGMQHKTREEVMLGNEELCTQINYFCNVCALCNVLFVKNNCET